MNDLGPPSKLPCVVCGKHDDNQLEPRYLYTVCRDHRFCSPVEINDKRRNRIFEENTSILKKKVEL